MENKIYYQQIKNEIKGYNRYLSSRQAVILNDTNITTDNKTILLLSLFESYKNCMNTLLVAATNYNKSFVVKYFICLNDFRIKSAIYDLLKKDERYKLIKRIKKNYYNNGWHKIKKIHNNRLIKKIYELPNTAAGNYIKQLAIICSA